MPLDCRLSRAARRMLLVLLVLTLAPAILHAQGTGPSLIIDPSIRAAGMGSASNAVTWGEGLDDWANPALLGYASGVRFSEGRTQLVPSLANVPFRTRRLTVGGNGVGLLMPGDFNGYGSSLLDYGPSQGTDQSGNPIADFGDSWEKIRAWGLGVSLAQVLINTLTCGKAEVPAILRHADIAAGYGDKQFDMSLGGFRSVAEAHDWGVLARATPVDRLDTREGMPLKVDLSYGYSVLGYNDASFPGFFEPSYLNRMYRQGGAADVVIGGCSRLSRHMERRPLLLASLDPLLEAGVAYDHERIQAGDQSQSGYDVDRFGAEVSIANLIHLRGGHVNDPSGDIVGYTWGWGLGFHVGRFAGFRYDHAEVPESGDLPNVKRDGFTAFFDPFALGRALACRRSI